MTPAERVARAVLKVVFAEKRLSEALDREKGVLKLCKIMATNTDRANKAWLDANLDYDAAFEAAKAAR